MFDWQIYISALLAMLTFGFAGWLISVAKKNVTLVDSMWSLFFLLSAVVYAYYSPNSPRENLLLAVVTLWALRLSIYLSWRNWHPHEDSRYALIRKNNAPHFWLKSLVIIFTFQAVLAWLISIPLLSGIHSSSPVNWLDFLGLALWLFGFMFTAVADVQLSRFKANSANKGRVLDTGLWRYSRHPNYFGECCVWWAYFIIGLAAAGFGAYTWLSVISPLLMTLLLLKVSGVALLESTITERRPEYAAYIMRTSAFIPMPPNLQKVPTK